MYGFCVAEFRLNLVFRRWLLVTKHTCILQVSFVFTNQVDGKLVPVESTVRSAAHQQNGRAATGDKGVQKTDSPSKSGRQSLDGKSLKMMGFNLKNSSLKCSTKSRTSPNCLQGLKKTSPSLDQPQIKKLHVASDLSDDDFVWLSIQIYIYNLICWFVLLHIVYQLSTVYVLHTIWWINEFNSKKIFHILVLTASMGLMVGCVCARVRACNIQISCLWVK